MNIFFPELLIWHAVLVLKIPLIKFSCSVETYLQLSSHRVIHNIISRPMTFEKGQE